MPTVRPDAELVERLLAGDEAAFRALVEQWSPGMLRLARTCVRTDESARDVVQDAWLAVVEGLDGFRAEASLRTWVFRIVLYTARRRGTTEARTVLLPEQDGGPSVDPARFRTEDPWRRHWTDAGAPRPWHEDPEDAAERAETRAVLAQALSQLPPRQRLVVLLRDVEGLTAEEACAVLQVSAANQRVLLHRARAALRAILETRPVGPTRTKEAS
ncbi:RNA polymerase sigma factor [Aquipuribacter nitratireducens]|uniref:RNA polymerase sigma factor n=1 Tax=Aquipuribacter nitratireducens TaxID=650104 RepID=A0ABW0GJM1_9MICO